MQLTFDTSQPIEDVLRVLGAMYNVDINLDPAREATATAPVSRVAGGYRRRSKSSGTTTRNRRSGPRANASSAEIRAWAVANGFEVGSKGRIAGSVVEAFRAQHK